MNAKQKEGESLQDYTKRFWVTKEVMESHVGGPLIFTKILSQTDGYTQLPMETVYQEKNAIIEKQVYEQFNALAYLEKFRSDEIWIFATRVGNSAIFGK